MHVCYMLYCTFFIEVTSHPSVDTAFHNLANVMDNHDGQYDMPYGHRYIPPPAVRLAVYVATLSHLSRKNDLVTLYYQFPC